MQCPCVLFVGLAFRDDIESIYCIRSYGATRHLGMYSATSTVNCTACPANASCLVGSTSIADCGCNPGHDNKAGPHPTTPCAACASGKYSTNASMRCATCLVGYTTLARPGASVCSACTRGTYSSVHLGCALLLTAGIKPVTCRKCTALLTRCIDTECVVPRYSGEEVPRVPCRLDHGQNHRGKRVLSVCGRPNCRIRCVT